MSNKIKLTISPAVAAYVRPGVPAETRLAGCRAATEMGPFDCITLLFCLSKDSEPSVKSSAISCIENLTKDVIEEYSASENAHPLVLDVLKRTRGKHAGIHDFSSMEDSVGATEDSSQFGREETVLPCQTESLPTDDSAVEESGSDDEEVVEEEGEEFLSKFKIAQMMGIGEKIKMALSGDKEWRAILVKDTNKLVSGSVMKNPRITESEVLKLIKSGIQNDEIMRLICANKEWIKSYQIRKSLIENNRTPVQSAIRYLATMGEKDLSGFAKSKNITSVISSMAKRMLLNKKR